MTPGVHTTAIVHPSAIVEHDVRIDAYAMIGQGVTLGPGTHIGARASVMGTTTIGPNCTIGIGAVLGCDPQDLKYRGEPTTLVIGQGTTIREYCTVHRGTAAHGTTTIGDHSYLMSYVHVAHDCQLGHHVIVANAVQLAGHVQLGNYAQIGGATPVHQFVRIGQYAYVGGGSRVPQDVPPFALTAGNPLRLYGINVEGLRRAGFSAERRLAIKRAYRLLFNSTHRREHAIDLLRTTASDVQDVRDLVEFVTSSTRGILS